jgi:hypothetical protein
VPICREGGQIRNQRESLTLRKEQSIVAGHIGASNATAELGAMGLYMLDAMIWILGTRGHIPQNGDFGPVRRGASFDANNGTLIRVLAAFVVTVACLSLALWLAVWCAIKLLGS